MFISNMIRNNISKSVSNEYFIDRKLSVNDASNIFNKSIATIRKLIELEKIKTIKDKNRVFILYSELVKIYGHVDNDYSITNEADISNNISNTHFEDQKEMYERLLNSKENLIENLEKEIDTKGEEIKRRDEEVTRIHQLLENQQKMQMHTQLQIEKIQLQLEEGVKNKTSRKRFWVF